MILVFGRTGQVARELQRQSAAVRALDRADADLEDPAACAAAIAAQDGLRAVINAAAYTAVDKAEEEEDRAQVINGDAPAAMARACAAKDIPLVHISTDYVFAGDGTRAWQPSDPVHPLGAYGRTKLRGETGVRGAGGCHAILRTSWVFSAFGSNFVKTMLRLSESRDALNVVEDQVGGPTPAAAIAAACLAIADQLTTDPQKSGTYHFSGAPDTSWKSFACETFARAGRDVAVTGIPTSAYPTPATRPLNSRLDCTTLRTTFGIARPDWRAGLQAVLEELGAATPATEGMT